ncbi:MAG: hypothetical protein ABSH16_05295 [Sedimentisphaerales bacterium]
MALLVSGVACPPYGGYFHLTVETGSIEIGRRAFYTILRDYFKGVSVLFNLG